MQYLVTMTTHVPDGTPEQVVNDIRAREALAGAAAMASVLAAAGCGPAPAAMRGHFTARDATGQTGSESADRTLCEPGGAVIFDHRHNADERMSRPGSRPYLFQRDGRGLR
jgi:hypothetical protein